jgi:hypothetical protein
MSCAAERSLDVAKSYYSTIFEQSADEIWNINSYPVWLDGAGESEIEAGKAADAVGAVRNILYDDKLIRQKLLAMSDVERSQIYEFAGAASIGLLSNGGRLSIATLNAARSGSILQ